LFIPTNAAIAAFLQSDSLSERVLSYHFSEQFIQPSAVAGKMKIPTLGKKYATLENKGTKFYLDGIEAIEESPLYLNGKYFKLGTVCEPKPNIYEWISENNTTLKRFIDELDSVILDLEKSKPIGFDPKGNTIYDSVTETINLFEEELFPIKHELRSRSATLVYPSKEAYHAALDVMANSLGGNFKNYNDIPYEWQEEILIPRLVIKGMFDNMVEPIEFQPRYENDSLNMKNILGDSVHIDYTISDKILCSNGYVYTYDDFTIPDSLYNGNTTFEAEWLLYQTGTNRFSWLPEVVYKSTESFSPLREYNSSSSNDSVVRVSFPKKYNGQFSIEFDGDYLFPRKYLMTIRTHMDYGGIYDIYVNNVKVKTFDYSYYVSTKGVYTSVTGKRYTPTGGRYNIFDCWVESISTYSKPRIKIEYKGPGTTVANNGLSLDYIKFTPASSIQ
jgi:hypothetical protein